MSDQMNAADADDAACCAKLAAVSQVMSDPEYDPDDAWFADAIIFAIGDLGLRPEAAEAWRNVEATIHACIQSAQHALVEQCLQAENAVSRSPSAARRQAWFDAARARCAGPSNASISGIGD